MKVIIKRGTKQTMNCEKCVCFFSYDDDDIETKSEYDKYEPLANFYSIARHKYIECPQCGNEIYILQSKEVLEENKRISDEMAKLHVEIVNQESIAKAIKEMKV